MVSDDYVNGEQQNRIVLQHTHAYARDSLSRARESFSFARESFSFARERETGEQRN